MSSHSDAADRALQRLRDPSHPAVAELARLLALQTRDVPLDALVPAEALAAHGAAAVRTFGEGDRSERWLRARLDEALAAAGAEPRPVREVLPVGTAQAIEAVLAPPYVASEALVFRLVDQPALQQLVRHVLDDALKAVGRRLGSTSDPEAPPPAWRELLRSVRNNLGDVAGTIVDVVKDEVDGVLDGRVRTAVTNASEGAIRTIARWLADPGHAAAFAEMRTAMATEVLHTPVADLAGPLDDSVRDAVVRGLVDTVRALAARPDLEARLEDEIRRALALTERRSLGAWLDELDLSDVYLEAATQLVVPAVQNMVTTEAFAGFWARLHEP